MAASINRVLLVANLTKDPELSTTQSGTSRCVLRVAFNERERVGDQWRDRSNYAEVVVWGNSGEACATHLQKGAPVAIDGRLRWESWEARDGGGHREALKIVASNVQFLPSGKRASGGAAYSEQSSEFAAPQTHDFGSEVGSAESFGGSAADDDIPF